jgi:hypothetical protein
LNGFDRVVIRAELEPDDAVHVVPARGEHQHGHRRARADRAQHIEAVDTRKHDVEHGELVGAGERAIQGAHAVGLGIEGEALPREVFSDHLRELHVVVDEQHACHAVRGSGRRSHCAH